MRVLAHLLVGGMLLLSACSQFFSEEAPVSDSGPGTASDSGLVPDCQGLALIQENFDADLDGNNWYIARSGGADARRSAGNLELTTSANAGDRSVTIGTYDEFPMNGALAIEILEIDLASDFDAAFYLRLDSNGGTNELGLSITPGSISLFGASTVTLPSTPFWLVLSVDGATAKMFTSSDGLVLSSPTTVSVASKPVTFLFGLSAGAQAVEHKVRLGQIGDLPAMPCQ